MICGPVRRPFSKAMCIVYALKMTVRTKFAIKCVSVHFRNNKMGSFVLNNTHKLLKRLPLLFHLSIFSIQVL